MTTIPLRLRYAMTIHMSQGQILPNVVVDLCKDEKVAGCIFVATSSVRSINDIVFEPMTFDRLRFAWYWTRLCFRVGALGESIAFALDLLSSYLPVAECNLIEFSSKVSLREFTTVCFEFSFKSILLDTI